MASAVLIVLAFLILVPGFCSLIVEERVCRLVGASRAIPSGLANSFQAEIRRSSRRMLRASIVVFPSVTDQAFVVRSIRGDGVLVLSQGLLSRCGEAELREVLRAGIAKLRKGRFSGAGASIAFWGWLLLRRTQTSGLWVAPAKAKTGTVGFAEFLRSMILFPWLNFCHQMSRRLWVVCGALTGGDGLFI